MAQDTKLKTSDIPSSRLRIERKGVATSMAHLHLGYVERFNHTFPLYDLDGLVVMMMRDGMSYEEALEYYSYNYVGAWTGEDTPGFFIGTTKTPLDEFSEA